MNPECVAAIKALVVTGMDPTEAERKVLAIHQLFPAATGIDLVTMTLNNVRPALPPELSDIAHIFGAGTVKQQVTTTSKAILSGLIIHVIWTIVGFVLLAVTFIAIGILVCAFVP